MRRKKVGLMGGTFDPIHTGHLILGEAAWRQCGLDEVWFMPAGNPRHKQHRAGRATDSQRIDMVTLATQSNPHFSVSLVEMNPDGYTYTYKTLARLSELYPNTDWTFIMGADSLTDFDKWVEPQKIADSCTIVVATRNSMPDEEFDALLALRRSQFGNAFTKLDTPNIDISSRHIREMIDAGESIRYYVPDNVLYYIRRYAIYLDLPGKAELL